MDGLLTLDLPPEEAEELLEASKGAFDEKYIYRCPDHSEIAYSGSKLLRVLFIMFLGKSWEERFGRRFG